MSSPDVDPTRPEASVIVVTHNNESLIASCLRSVQAALRVHTYEVIVVDNHSSDGTLSAIPEEVSARVIALERNAGFAAANNAGIQVSRGRLIVLVNSDAFPDPGSIDRLIEAIDGLPHASIVGGRLRYPTGKQQPSFGRFPSLLGGLWVALLLHRLPLTARAGIGVSAHPALYRRRRRVDWVTAAFCVARREAGPLPADAFMYGEDVAWAQACRRAGSEVWFDPDATAVHIGRASVDQSQDPGFAQRRRAHFELEWFAGRGHFVQLAARGVLAVHALVRLAIYGALGTIRRRRDRRIAENKALLRAALSRHRMPIGPVQTGPPENPIL
ncbi:MAG: dTDP-Rha:a-D-GlcNAc-diphosphoryl polyprenol, a-3-L-rhamnosyl transferase [Solirubrobacterales bacterium]|jgi:GT2 family glycosyltransferase|nr:dTDP-Rha:a-D-GlcNAc-diphosphoryl polyprenol, a-3-L-rhamnosyl transferase [Solirubrobacterales bacterium]